MSTPNDEDALIRNSAVMAAGTIFSRLSGFLRSALLAAALGTQLHADVFTIANTVPNMLYILLAGGVFNAVLVPQLVRSMKADEDGGEAYTNRIITLAALFLVATTALLVAGAPWLMRLYLDGAYFTPDLTDQRESVIAFARLCLPQVFFYGMYVLVGQVLNSRRRFGPMMWAPIANNIIAIIVLISYLVVFGPARGDELQGGYSTGEEVLLGLGSTLGIAVQFMILLPYLRSAGFTYRPRFDFRGTGLGHTLRLGTWTVAFVIVNQIAYTVVVRLASSGTAEAASQTASNSAAGYTVYAGAFLLIMVPHSIATVSLATASLPRLSELAASNDRAGLAKRTDQTVRTALALVVPFCFVLPTIALPLANVVWGYAAAASTFDDFARTLVMFAPGLVFFTIHYVMLRGFYALEKTRTVFYIQCGIAVVNVLAALTLVRLASPSDVAPALALAYGVAYAVGALTSYRVLARRLDSSVGSEFVRFAVRLLIVAGATGCIVALVGWGSKLALEGYDPVLAASKVVALLSLLVLGAVTALCYALGARIFRIQEVNEVVALVTRRLPGRRVR